MDYLALAKRAYKLTIENKFLWIFGFLAGSVGGLTGYQFSSLNGSSSKTENIDHAKLQQLLDQLRVFYETHTMTILAVALAVLLFMVLMFILSILSQGALISSVARLNKAEKVDFWKGLKDGGKYFWRIWGLMIAYSMIIFLAMAVLCLPLLVTISSANVVLTVLWAIIALLLIFLVCLVISFVAPYSQCLVVLKNKGVIESIKDGFEFVRTHILNIFVVYLMLMAIGIIFGIGLGILVLILGAVLALIGIAIGLTSIIAGSIYALACIIIFVLLISIIMGAYNAYQTAVITLAYEQLKHKAT